MHLQRLVRLKGAFVTSMALVLLACGGQDTPAPDLRSYPRFDPATGDLPLNTDLAFAGTTDGTAHVGASSDPVRLALNQLDGFSTSAYFDVLLSGSIAPATAEAARSVWLFELETGSADPLDLASVTGVRTLAAFDVQVVSLDGGTDNAIRLRPTQPLKPGAKYLVALTDELRSPAGDTLRPAPAYASLRGTDAIDSASQSLRSAVQAWEQLAAQAVSGASQGALTPQQAKAKLLLSYTFTTTDAIKPLVAMAAPRAAIASQQIQDGVAPGTAVDNAQQLNDRHLLSQPAARDLDISVQTGIDFHTFSSALLASVGTLYTGYIQLPYYLQAPAAGAYSPSFLQHPWRPDAALAASLDRALAADADGSYNLTGRYPFAAATGTESVPLQLTLPQASWEPGYAGRANCGQIYAATGYPVVMYVHGITSDRSSVLALAHTLAARCIATVAIDLPLHGVPANSTFVGALNVEHSQLVSFGTLYAANAPRERHFNVAGAMGSPAPMNFAAPGPLDGSGSQFNNLANLTGTRDHNRQAVMDLLNLNASLGAVDARARGFGAPGLDRNRVYVVGMSLGGIVGSVYTTVNQLAIARDAKLGLISPLNPIRGLVANVAGAQVSQILVRSATFGPQVHAGLAGFGMAPGSSSYERFLYTAQSALDSADPVNFAGTLATLNVPVLVQQINGDAVIPNDAAQAPLAGTAALARLLDTTPLGLGSTPLGRGYVRLQAGGHSSLLRPEGGSPHVTAELQTQVGTFVQRHGNVEVGSAAPGLVQLP